MKVTLPLTRETIGQFVIGDVLKLHGDILTARDAAHRRFAQAVQRGEELPVDLTNQIIFYAGPCPTKPGRIIGPIAPTTSVRMDPYMELMLKKGMIASIGKGDRGKDIPALIKKYKGLYLVGIGGTSALISKSVTAVEEIAYQDLKTESIKRLHVEGMKVMVAIDASGRVLHEEEQKKYQTAE